MTLQKPAIIKLFWAFASVLIISSHGCKRRHDSTSTQSGYGVPQPMTWPTTVIPVCWENGRSEEAAQWKAAWQDIVNREYGKTVLRFENWSRCSEHSGGIRIELYGEDDIQYFPNGQGTEDVYIDGALAYTRSAKPSADGHPRSTSIGYVQGSQPGNIIMNTKLLNVNPALTTLAVNLGTKARTNLQLTIFLHELGHRIGLYHEQARPDSVCQGESDSNQGALDGVLLGRYDPDSIMNYCQTHHADYQDYIHLSPGDISAINQLYKPSRLERVAQ